MKYDSIQDVVTEWYFVTGVYIGLCLMHLFVGLHIKNKLIIIVLKCAPILFLIAMTFSAVAGNRFGPLTSNRSELENMFWGLVFSCIGDFYLVFDNLFLLGVGSFAIAQAIYVFLFDGPSLLMHPFGQIEVTTAIAVGLVSALIYLYLLPKFSPVLAVALFVYCVLISTMLWSAIVRAQINPSAQRWSAAVGACLFYTSDMILGLKRWRLNIPCGDFLVMSTYFGAQMFIVRSEL